MRIEQTNIPNVLPETIDQNKIYLAESIMQSVYPLFDEVYKGRVKNLETYKEKVEKGKNEIKKQKDELEQLVNEYNRQKKINKLLDRLEKMINSGLVYEGSFKHEVVVLLKVLNKLSVEKLDHHLHQTLQTLSKRFSR